MRPRQANTVQLVAPTLLYSVLATVAWVGVNIMNCYRCTTAMLEVLTQSIDALQGGKRIWPEERDPLLILLGLRSDLEGWGRSRADRHG